MPLPWNHSFEQSLCILGDASQASELPQLRWASMERGIIQDVALAAWYRQAACRLRDALTQTKSHQRLRRAKVDLVRRRHANLTVSVQHLHQHQQEQLVQFQATLPKRRVVAVIEDKTSAVVRELDAALLGPLTSFEGLNPAHQAVLARLVGARCMPSGAWDAPIIQAVQQAAFERVLQFPIDFQGGVVAHDLPEGFSWCRLNDEDKTWVLCLSDTFSQQEQRDLTPLTLRLFDASPAGSVELTPRYLYLRYLMDDPSRHLELAAFLQSTDALIPSEFLQVVGDLFSDQLTEARQAFWRVLDVFHANERESTLIAQQLEALGWLIAGDVQYLLAIQACSLVLVSYGVSGLLLYLHEWRQLHLMGRAHSFYQGWFSHRGVEEAIHLLSQEGLQSWRRLSLLPRSTWSWWCALTQHDMNHGVSMTAVLASMDHFFHEVSLCFSAKQLPEKGFESLCLPHQPVKVTLGRLLFLVQHSHYPEEQWAAFDDDLSFDALAPLGMYVAAQQEDYTLTSVPMGLLSDLNHAPVPVSTWLTDPRFSVADKEKQYHRMIGQQTCRIGHHTDYQSLLVDFPVEIAGFIVLLTTGEAICDRAGVANTFDKITSVLKETLTRLSQDIFIAHFKQHVSLFVHWVEQDALNITDWMTYASLLEDVYQVCRIQEGEAQALQWDQLMLSLFFSHGRMAVEDLTVLHQRIRMSDQLTLSSWVSMVFQVIETIPDQMLQRHVLRLFAVCDVSLAAPQSCKALLDAILLYAKTHPLVTIGLTRLAAIDMQATGALWGEALLGLLNRLNDPKISSLSHIDEMIDQVIEEQALQIKRAYLCGELHQDAWAKGVISALFASLDPQHMRFVAQHEQIGFKVWRKTRMQAVLNTSLLKIQAQLKEAKANPKSFMLQQKVCEWILDDMQGYEDNARQLIQGLAEHPEDFDTTLLPPLLALEKRLKGLCNKIITLGSKLAGAALFFTDVYEEASKKLNETFFTREPDDHRHVDFVPWLKVWRPWLETVLTDVPWEESIIPLMRVLTKMGLFFETSTLLLDEAQFEQAFSLLESLVMAMHQLVTYRGSLSAPLIVHLRSLVNLLSGSHYQLILTFLVDVLEEGSSLQALKPLLYAIWCVYGAVFQKDEHAFLASLKAVEQHAFALSEKDVHGKTVLSLMQSLSPTMKLFWRRYREEESEASSEKQAQFQHVKVALLKKERVFSALAVPQKQTFHEEVIKKFKAFSPTEQALALEISKGWVKKGWGSKIDNLDRRLNEQRQNQEKFEKSCEAIQQILQAIDPFLESITQKEHEEWLLIEKANHRPGLEEKIYFFDQSFAFWGTDAATAAFENMSEWMLQHVQRIEKWPQADRARLKRMIHDHQERKWIPPKSEGLLDRVISTVHERLEFSSGLVPLAQPLWFRLSELMVDKTAAETLAILSVERARLSQYQTERVSLLKKLKYVYEALHQHWKAATTKGGLHEWRFMVLDRVREIMQIPCETLAQRLDIVQCMLSDGAARAQQYEIESNRVREYLVAQRDFFKAAGSVFEREMIAVESDYTALTVQEQALYAEIDTGFFTARLVDQDCYFTRALNRKEALMEQAAQDAQASLSSELEMIDAHPMMHWVNAPSPYIGKVVLPFLYPFLSGLIDKQLQPLGAGVWRKRFTGVFEREFLAITGDVPVDEWCRACDGYIQQVYVLCHEMKMLRQMVQSTLAWEAIIVSWVELYDYQQGFSLQQLAHFSQVMRQSGLGAALPSAWAKVIACFLEVECFGEDIDQGLLLLSETLKNTASDDITQLQERLPVLLGALKAAHQGETAVSEPAASTETLSIEALLALPDFPNRRKAPKPALDRLVPVLEQIKLLIDQRKLSAALKSRLWENVCTIERHAIKENGHAESDFGDFLQILRAQTWQLKQQEDKGWTPDKCQWVARLKTLLFQITGIDLNSTQLLALLSANQTQAPFLIEMKTGQGKSYVAALLAVLGWVEYGTARVLSANAGLVKQDFDDKNLKLFFQCLGIRTGIMTLSSAFQSQEEGIYYSTAWDWAFCRAEHILAGRSLKLFLTGMVIADEFDYLFLRMVSVSFDYVKTHCTDNVFQWVYPRLLAFISRGDFLNTDLDDPACWSDRIDIAQFREHLSSTGLSEAQRYQLSLLPKAKLDKWINAACLAKSVAKQQYVIRQDPARRTGVELRPVVQDVPQDQGVFRDGVQQALIAYSQEKQASYQFDMPSEVDPADTEIPLNIFLECPRFIGLSGTLSVQKEETLYLSSTFGVEGVVMPPHEPSLLHVRDPLLCLDRADQLRMLVDQLNIIPDDEEAGRRPVLVFEETADEARQVYEVLKHASVATHWTIQCLDGSESVEQRTLRLAQAACANTITVCSAMFARGINLMPKHPEGLLVLVLVLRDEGFLWQAFGRGARYQQRGEGMLILDANATNLLAARSLPAAERSLAIQARYQQMTHHTAIRRYYTNQSSLACVSTLRLWDEIECWLKGKVRQQAGEQAAWLMALRQFREGLILEMHLAWKDSLEATDPECQQDDLYVRQDQQGQLDTTHLDALIKQFPHRLQQVWNEAMQRLLRMDVIHAQIQTHDVFKLEWLVSQDIVPHLQAKLRDIQKPTSFPASFVSYDSTQWEPELRHRQACSLVASDQSELIPLIADALQDIACALHLDLPKNHETLEGYLQWGEQIAAVLQRHSPGAIYTKKDLHAYKTWMTYRQYALQLMGMIGEMSKKQLFSSSKQVAQAQALSYKLKIKYQSLHSKVIAQQLLPLLRYAKKGQRTWRFWLARPLARRTAQSLFVALKRLHDVLPYQDTEGGIRALQDVISAQKKALKGKWFCKRVKSRLKLIERIAQEALFSTLPPDLLVPGRTVVRVDGSTPGEYYTGFSLLGRPIESTPPVEPVLPHQGDMRRSQRQFFETWAQHLDQKESHLRAQWRAVQLLQSGQLAGIDLLTVPESCLEPLKKYQQLQTVLSGGEALWCSTACAFSAEPQLNHLFTTYHDVYHASPEQHDETQQWHSESIPKAWLAYHDALMAYEETQQRITEYASREKSMKKAYESAQAAWQTQRSQEGFFYWTDSGKSARMDQLKQQEMRQKATWNIEYERLCYYVRQCDYQKSLLPSLKQNFLSERQTQLEQQALHLRKILQEQMDDCTTLLESRAGAWLETQEARLLELQQQREELGCCVR
ncbi:MAG: hypothetical protein NTW08_06955 [Gammaproteobacteria bacterium]|nr:hypothetical protein [Gammaproteobacteria bacterium]